MAINRDSNGYTFGFAIVLVVIVGTILSVLSIGLKPQQEKNDVVKKVNKIINKGKKFIIKSLLFFIL